MDRQALYEFYHDCFDMSEEEAEAVVNRLMPIFDNLDKFFEDTDDE